MHKTMACLAVLLAATMAGCIEGNDADTAVICTNFGAITVTLFREEAPITTQNFIDLADSGYYDGVTFHRIITGFMMQGGDPQGTGAGGEAHGGGTIPDEFDPSLRHDRGGLLSMANAGPNTGGSQFFITFVATPWLDDKHSIFGEVTEGMDIVERVEEDAGSQSGTPQEEVFMTTVVPGGTAADCPEIPAPEPASISADAITPGVWSVTAATGDSLFVWAENTGGETGEVTWSMTGPDGAALPDGWSVTFDEATQEARGGQAIYTMARIEVPDGTAGDFPLELHTEWSTTAITATVALGEARVSKEGDAVNVQYAGRCTKDNEPFDDGEFPLTLGGGRAIVGFDLGLVGMAEGEPQTIVLPAAHAYGSNSGPCAGLDPADLTFDVEILSFSS